LSLPIYLFWKSLLEEPSRFVDRINSVALSTEEWLCQREIFRGRTAADNFDIGFSTFYLNRTNRSGVLNGGMIGGLSQSSAYGIDARFNRAELSARVERIARNAARIEITNQDATSLIGQIEALYGEGVFLYIDPPYYKKGRDLYYDFYKEKDHLDLRNAIGSLPDYVPWIVSYDNVPEIAQLYADYNSIEYDLNYSVKNGRIGRELMFFSDGTFPIAVSDAGLGDRRVA
jgi:DNA adenine methylase